MTAKSSENELMAQLECYGRCKSAYSRSADETSLTCTVKREPLLGELRSAVSRIGRY